MGKHYQKMNQNLCFIISVKIIAETQVKIMDEAVLHFTLNAAQL